MSKKNKKLLKSLKKQIKQLAGKIDDIQIQLDALKVNSHSEQEQQVVFTKSKFTEEQVEDALEDSEDAEEASDMFEKRKKR
jgi:predicted metal-binding transcription factor (methanogenesis marker protein 9)